MENWNTDALITPSLKQAILDKVESEDDRIVHAYRVYIPCRDYEGFKARIIHLFTQNNSDNALSGEERQSSMTTAGFNRSADYLSRFSRGSSGMYPSINQIRPQTNSRVNRPDNQEKVDSEYGMQSINSTDRYLPIIINLENSNFLDEQSASIIKTLILEENIDVFRIINSYLARAYDEQELCSRLFRYAS